jgi:hypothetical protein
MNSVTGQSHQSFTNAWVTNSGAVGVGVSTTNLGPEVIAVYDADISCNAEEALSLSAPSFKKTKRVKIKQGIHPFTGGDNFALSRAKNIPRETFEFTKHDIISWTGLKARKGSKQHIVALGYDGLDASKSLNAKLDVKPILFTFTLEGDPIQRYFGQNRVQYEYTIDKGMCPSDCECTDTCGKVDCKTIQAGLHKAMSYQFPRVLGNGMVVRRPITDFVKINTISKCTTAPATVPLTEFKKWQIKICDDGVSTLGLLSAALPNKKIVLESRVDSVSTYSFWQASSETAPAEFVLTTHVQPICGVCPTCPDTYTSVPAVKVVQVTVACGAAAPAVTAAITTTKIASTLGGGDVYIVKVPSTRTDAAIKAQLDALACLSYELLGEESQLCVGSEAEFTWKSCETCNKTVKDYMITLGDKDCGTADWLAELQAAYPKLVISIDKTGTCIHTYKTTVMSDCISDEDCGKEKTFEFEAPATFKGQAWVDYKVINTAPDCTVPAAVTPDCCACGIIVEGKQFTRNYIECTQGWETFDPSEILGIKVHVTATSYDYTNNPCDDTKEYITTLQQPVLPRGASGLLVQKYEKATLAYENKYFDTNPYVNQVDGFHLVSKPHLFYDTYTLKLRRRGMDTTYILNEQDTQTYYFYVPEGGGKQIEALINPLVLSAGNSDLKAVVL